MQNGNSVTPRMIKRLVVLLVAAVALYFTLYPAQKTSSVRASNEKITAVEVSQDVDCASCHAEYAQGIAKTVHGKAKQKSSLFRSGEAIACQSCHGDGRDHVADLTDRSKMSSPAKLAANEITQKCMQCHLQVKEHTNWAGSKHDMAGVSCLSCHSVHHSPLAAMTDSKLFATAQSETKLLKMRNEADTCYQCHNDVRKAQFQRSTHLFRSENRDQQITCSSCHEAHGGIGDKMMRTASINESCYQCHTEKRGPYLYEHSPVRENCGSCHKAHGSNNTALLVSRAPMLCQQCHMQGRHQTVAGKPNLAFATNRSCTNCHSAIHGSNHPSGINLQR